MKKFASSTLTLTFTLLLLGASQVAPVRAETPVITLVTTYVYPGSDKGTYPFQINNHGDVVGYFLGTSVTAGFVRRHDGTFSRPIVDPSANGATLAIGINSSRELCGSFANADFNLVGFFLVGQSFTEYAFPGATSTSLVALNDNGDFVGHEDGHAFASIGGVTTIIDIPGASVTYATAINNNGQIVGYFEETASKSHGFLRNPDGSLIGPIDYPGSVSTVVNSINNGGVLVGGYSSTMGPGRAFLLKLPGTFISYGYPQGKGTNFTGINDSGYISGLYSDSSLEIHALIAQVSLQ